MNNQKTPLFRVARRTPPKRTTIVIIYAAAILSALILASVFLAVLGVNPFVFFMNMITIGIIGNPYPQRAIINLITTFVPLFMTSMALSLAFRMRFWNIGGEGQFILGSIAAATVAFKLGEILPAIVLLPLMFIAGIVAGGIYAGITALLKVKFNTNETLITLMLNYIALYFINFLGITQGDWNFFLSKESLRAIFGSFPEASKMPAITLGKFQLNISLIIALIICLLIYIYIRYTKQGYEISVVGDSLDTARYAGMNVPKVIIRTVLISGALIGLAGAMHASTQGILSTTITNDVGWTGVVVAWLAKLNIGGIAVTSLLLSVLDYGCQTASVQFSSLDSHFSEMLQGIILFSVLAADFFISYKLVFREKASKTNIQILESNDKPKGGVKQND